MVAVRPRAAPEMRQLHGPLRLRAHRRDRDVELTAGGRARGIWQIAYLDFLEGKVDFSCTAWGVPSYSVFGWQRPCYLMSDGAYAKSFRELIEETEWSRYGRGRHPKCANCMAHCGYEPTAVLATLSSPREAVRAAFGR